jgi:hypothetical protein
MYFMSAAEIEEIKSNLIKWINELSDPVMLSILDGVRISNSGGDWWNDLTEDQKNHINEGIEDEENGRVISSEEFWERLKNS